MLLSGQQGLYMWSFVTQKGAGVAQDNLWN